MWNSMATKDQAAEDEYGADNEGRRLSYFERNPVDVYQDQGTSLKLLLVAAMAIHEDEGHVLEVAGKNKKR